MSSLLTKRRFLPYFATQFFGAFNDNIFKNTLLLFVAFASREQLAISSDLFINLAAGLFILPFFLFSASAGIMADKYEKSGLIRNIKLLEIAIMCCGAIGFITQSYLILLFLLFLMGTQSALFGPVKYALLPQQLKSEELVNGNALVEMGTFIAILLGTLVAGLIASTEQAKIIAAVAVVLFALLGYFASRHIPPAPASAPSLVMAWRPIAHTKATLTIAHRHSTVLTVILAISWFWFIGAVYLTQFPNFTKVYLNGSENAVSTLLALFSIGIAVGSLACDKLSMKRVELGMVPIASFMISLFGLLLVNHTPTEPELTNRSFVDFISNQALWPMFFDLFMLGASGGLFIVPLYTFLQKQAKPTERAQVIAALNIYNSLFMVVSAIIGIVFLSLLEREITELFLILSLLNLFIAAFLLYKAPIYSVRFILSLLAKLLYRVKYSNIDNIPQQGGTLLICNHVSYIDALLLSVASPRLIRFVMEADYANLPILRAFLRKAGVIPICAKNPMTLKAAFEEVEIALQAGDLVCIFPEGKLTADGKVALFQRGIDVILKRNNVNIVPIALKGLWGSYFSRHKGTACHGLPSRFRAPIEINVGHSIDPSQATRRSLRSAVINLLS
jgi:1-acyl-sn-glycerol-3-phosphate acyltransferase